MYDTNVEFYLDKELEQRIEEQLKEGDCEVLKLLYKDDFVWIKQARETKSNNFHKFAYSITKIRGMMPVEDKTKEQTLYYEVSKIKRLKQKGIKVPSIIGCNKKLFALEDTGKDVRSYLSNKEIPIKEVESTIEKCTNILSVMHNADEYHGGPQVKNYTVKDGIISAIDFEDSFSKNVNLKDIKYRDFFLFLVSLAELRREVNYKEVIEIYKKNTNNLTIDKELKKVAWNLNFLVKIVEIEFLKKKFSKDVIYNYNLIKALQQL